MNHSNDYLAALTGFVCVLINHFTGLLDMHLLFQYFNSETLKAFILGAIGALGGLIAKQFFSISLKVLRMTLDYFFRKNATGARK